MGSRCFIISIAILLSCNSAGRNQGFKITFTTFNTGVSSSLRGLSVVNDTIVWSSGSNGMVLHTIDGQQWIKTIIDDADSLDFRDIQAFDQHRALVLSAGNPGRIYKTVDGGESWVLVYEDTRNGIFFDAMDFWNDQHGIAFGDAIDSHLVIIITKDGGTSWQDIDKSAIPVSPVGEGGFAASGTCLTTFGDEHVWIGLGSPDSRVFISQDMGQSWQVVNTPMKGSSPSQGIFSLDFSTNKYGVAVGGDYEHPKDSTSNAAITTNGGLSWTLIEKEMPHGYRSAVAHIPDTDYWIATGPTGTDLSYDMGKTWTLVDIVGYHALAFSGNTVGWLSGKEGRIAKIEFSPQ